MWVFEFWFLLMFRDLISKFSLLFWVLLMHGGSKLMHGGSKCKVLFFFVLVMFWDLTFDFRS